MEQIKRYITGTPRRAKVKLNNLKLKIKGVPVPKVEFKLWDLKYKYAIQTSFEIVEN